MQLGYVVDVADTVGVVGTVDVLDMADLVDVAERWIWQNRCFGCGRHGQREPDCIVVT